MRYDQVTMAPPLTKVTRAIIITCVVLFFGEVLFKVPLAKMGFDLPQIFGLVPFKVVEKFWVWQLVTYIFLHGGPLHLLLNLLILWYFGSEIEMRMGERRFLIFFLICGIGAGLCNILVNYGFSDADRLSRPVIGASGAVYGVLAAYGLFFRDRYMLLMFIFPIKAMYFALVMFGLELAMGLNQQDNVAHFAHLGGLVVGGLYVYLVYYRPGGGKGRSKRDAEKERLKRQFTLIVNESAEKSQEKNGPFWN